MSKLVPEQWWTSDPQDNVFTCFARQTDAHPDAVAVIDEQGQTTYQALAARADAVARYLLSNGLTPEQPVGVLMARRAEMLAVLLGIWKAGGAYVPFDPRDPADRVSRMQSSCGITRVIGDHQLLHALKAECDAADRPSPITIDVTRISRVAEDAAPLTQPEGGARLAYLLFTSGSTGEPKAVEVEHQQVIALLLSACELLQFGPHDRYLAASTIAFDASITELFLPLVTGASLLMRDRTLLLDPRRMAREVREHGVTVLQTGPSVWQVMLAEVEDFPRVRVAITHGEAVAPELAQRLAAQGDTVWNLYGPTETTVWATAARLRANDPPGLSTISAPIGRPLKHVRALVLDVQGNSVPDGTTGELCLGGPSVARGYRSNEALTGECFVMIAGERYYRSGDLVVRDDDANLHYFGRNDDQLQVRGVRVEPGEIEAALLRDHRVSQAVVTWFTTQNGSRAIVAAVVLQQDESCRVQELYEVLTQRLPSPMIPARILFLPSLPSTTSGKIDRKAISRDATATAAEAGVSSREESGGPGTRPGREKTNTEHALARVWERMLGVSSVAPDDHFFTIGGDSLAAVQVMVEAEARFGLELPVHLVFEAPTLEALALRIDRAKQSVDDELSSEFVFPLAHSGDGTPVFFCGVDLSLARRNLWTMPCPLFAIINWVKGSGFVRAKSLEALAATHLESVRQIQPDGPYRLAGYSMGGLIAFEMAQQLRHAGEVVELLFLLDPMAPNTEPSPDNGPPQNTTPIAPGDPLRRRLAHHLGRIKQGPGEEGLRQWLRTIILLPTLRLIRRLFFVDWLYYLAVNYYLRHPNAASRLLFPRNRWRAFWFAAQRMVASYSARPYDGNVLAVFCQQGPRGEVWNALLGPDTQRYTLDASHLALFEEPALGIWMEWVSECIRKIDAKATDKPPLDL